MQDAIPWATKVANYLNEHVSGVNIQVLRNICGPRLQVHWVSSYESLAAFEETTKRIETDTGYQQLLAAGRQQQLFVGSTIVDNLYEAVS